MFFNCYALLAQFPSCALALTVQCNFVIKYQRSGVAKNAALEINEQIGECVL
jgi:hypothetical protein